MNKINKNYPPPWNLRGTGFVFLFPSNEKYILENGFLSAEDRSAYKGGLGGFVLANYEDSNVGPYYELLFIPGNFEQNEKMFKRITKIYVSSRLSVEQGIKNWAIPKEYADFSWIEKGSKTFVTVSVNKKTILEIEIEKHFFSFPVTTGIFPITLLQKSKTGFLSTRFIGKGSGKIATISSFKSDPNFFPDILQCAKWKIPGIGIRPFELIFPVPDKIN